MQRPQEGIHDRDRDAQHAAGCPRGRSTAFFHVELRDDGGRHGILVEYADTSMIFTNPSDKRTEDYVTGRFG